MAKQKKLRQEREDELNSSILDIHGKLHSEVIFDDHPIAKSILQFHNAVMSVAFSGKTGSLPAEPTSFVGSDIVRYLAEVRDAANTPSELQTINAAIKQVKAEIAKEFGSFNTAEAPESSPDSDADSEPDPDPSVDPDPDPDPSAPPSSPDPEPDDEEDSPSVWSKALGGVGRVWSAMKAHPRRSLAVMGATASMIAFGASWPAALIPSGLVYATKFPDLVHNVRKKISGVWNSQPVVETRKIAKVVTWPAWILPVSGYKFTKHVLRQFFS